MVSQGRYIEEKEIIKLSVRFLNFTQKLSIIKKNNSMMINKILRKLRTNYENTLHGQFSSQPTHKFFWKIIFSFLTTHINLIHKNTHCKQN